MLYRICNQGYADWIPYFCDEEGDSYTINHIYLDSDGDPCLNRDNPWEVPCYRWGYSPSYSELEEEYERRYKEQRN